MKLGGQSHVIWVNRMIRRDRFWEWAGSLDCVFRIVIMIFIETYQG